MGSHSYFGKRQMPSAYNVVVGHKRSQSPPTTQAIESDILVFVAVIFQWIVTWIVPECEAVQPAQQTADSRCTQMLGLNVISLAILSVGIVLLAYLLLLPMAKGLLFSRGVVAAKVCQNAPVTAPGIGLPNSLGSAVY